MDWLSDEHVNGVLRLMAQKCARAAMLGYEKPTAQTRVLVASSFYFESLRARGMESVARWTRSLEVGGAERLVFPLFSAAHWSMCAIFLPQRAALVLDPLRPLHRDAALELLRHSAVDCVVYDSGAAQQAGSRDCGVYALYFAGALVFENGEKARGDVPQKFVRRIRSRIRRNFR